MLVILVRHAKAFERDLAAWPDDLRRPLTAAGRESFSRLAKRLGRVTPAGAGGIERVLASPAVRSWQTAQVLHERSGWPAPERCEELLPDREDVAAWSTLLRTLADRRRGIHGTPLVRHGVALVGHEPSLGRMASWLLTGSCDGMRFQVRKGAAIAMEIDVNAIGSTATPSERGALLWMVSPRIALRWKGIA